MKKLIRTLFLGLSLLLVTQSINARGWYVSNTGDDDAEGTELAPLQTITKINSLFAASSGTRVLPGDSIYFKSGDVWDGTTLVIGKSGTSSDRITITKYGEGDKPIINGFTTISGWTSQGDTIYYKDVSVESNPTFISINGVPYAMGRYPNTNQFLTYESFNTNKSITDTSLPNSPSWVGAGLTIKVDDYRTESKIAILSQVDGLITYSVAGEGNTGLKNGFGYFFQNDIRTLDTFGEWYYNGTRLYVHFDSEDPTDYTVQISIIDNLIYNSNKSYITLDNLNLVGASRSAVRIASFLDEPIVQNLDISYSGYCGIEGRIAFRTGLIDNNNINYSMHCGIYLDSAPDVIVTNNTVRNTTPFLGADITGSSTASSAGIRTNYSDRSLVQYNRVDSSGYNGIYFSSLNALIKNNYITNSVLILNDGAGIYTSGRTHAGRQIVDNIVIGAVGSPLGTPYDGTVAPNYIYRRWARGIYLDSDPIAIITSGNTTSGGDFGIFVGSGDDQQLLNNTSFDNGFGALQIQNYSTMGPPTNMIMKNNIWAAKAVTERSFRAYMPESYVEPAFAIADSNYFIRPISEGSTIQLGIGDVYYTLGGWKTAFGLETNSKIWAGSSLASDTMVKMYINPTKLNDTITVADMLDIDANLVNGEVVIEPYGSIILIHDPDTTTLPPHKPIAYTDSIDLVWRGKLLVYATIGGADSVGTVSERGVVWSTTGVPTTSDNKLIVGSGLGSFTATIRTLDASTTYYVRAYAINELDDPAYGSTFVVNVPVKSYLQRNGVFLEKNGSFLKIE